jgi:hypothetical protein
MTPAELAVEFVQHVESTEWAIRWVDGATTVSKPHQPEFPPFRFPPEIIRQSVRDWLAVRGHLADVEAVAVAVEELLRRDRGG